MNTQHLTSSPDDLQYAAKLLQSGQIVGMPTETVYGLAADALNPDAVKKVFEAKGKGRQGGRTLRSRVLSVVSGFALHHDC